LVIDTATNDMNTKIMLTVFSLIDDLSRTYISERTKAGLKALRDKGIKLGKPTGTVQLSMYDKDKDKILELFKLGVPIKKIIETHLQYGKPQSLTKYIKKLDK
jgi:DNA invertase Pin-like site-specific DNA recombinase